MPVLEANAGLLHRLGFDFSPLGPGTVAVNSIPEGLADDKMSVTAMIFEILTSLEEEKVSLAGAIYAPLAEKLAVSASRAASVPTSPEAAGTIVDRLYACENPEFTPAGKRVVAVLRPEDLEKLLK